MHKHIVVDTTEEEKLLEELNKRTDFEALRMKRYLAMPDLSRTEGNPIKKMVDKVCEVEAQKNFDIIKIPEITPVEVSFDKFNFAPDHPARSKSDTYYIDKNNILRTHDTVMWYYYFTRPEIQERAKKGQPLGVICYGKVYRKDEIDKHHMNVFHQIGGTLLVPDDSKTKLTVEDLKTVLAQIAQSIFGKGIKYRFNEDTFPYTDPSVEMEIEKNGKWVEVLGGGMNKKSVMKNFGIENYHGWAYGFGIERLAIIDMELPDIRLLWSKDERVTKQLKLGHKFKAVSKYPPVIRDISFIVPKDFVPNDYFDLIREIGKDLVEEVALLDKYENDEKFGKDKISYTYRIFYRSPEKTLTAEEVEPLQNKLYEETKKQYKAALR